MLEQSLKLQINISHYKDNLIKGIEVTELKINLELSLQWKITPCILNKKARNTCFMKFLLWEENEVYLGSFTTSMAQGVKTSVQMLRFMLRKQLSQRTKPSTPDSMGYYSNYYRDRGCGISCRWGCGCGWGGYRYTCCLPPCYGGYGFCLLLKFFFMSLIFGSMNGLSESDFNL